MTDTRRGEVFACGLLIDFEQRCSVDRSAESLWLPGSLSFICRILKRSVAAVLPRMLKMHLAIAYGIHGRSFVLPKLQFEAAIAHALAIVPLALCLVLSKTRDGAMATAPLLHKSDIR
jgi:hypothetical protein